METQTKNIGEERKKSIIESLKKNLAYVVFMPFLFIAIVLFSVSASSEKELTTEEEIKILEIEKQIKEKELDIEKLVKEKQKIFLGEAYEEVKKK